MDSSESKLKEMNDRLLSILKCRTCSDYVVPPIAMCSKGHILCETCSLKLSSCSTCKEKFAGRNYTMQKVAELVIYPCKYASAGCAAKLRGKDKVIHEQDCLLRPLPCLFTDCKLEFNISDYLQHLNNTHLDYLVVGTDRVAELVIYPCKYASAGCAAKLRVKDKVIHEQDCLLRPLPCLFTDCEWESNISHYLQHLNNTHLDYLIVGTDQVVRVSLRNDRKCECVFSAFERFFLIKFTTTATMLEWKVICEGSIKEASKFYFTFSISDPKNTHNSFQFSCTPCSIESKENFGRQLAIPIDLIYTYSDVNREDSIPIKINVHNIPEDT